MPPKTAPPAVANPVASSSWLGRNGGSPLRANARAAAIVSVKLISVIPSAPGHSCASNRKIRERERGQAARNLADGLDSVIAEPKQRHGGDARGDGHERRGHARHEPLEPKQQRDHREPDRERGGGRLGQAPEQSEEILEERALREMHAEQLRHLIEHDHDADAGFEPGQHGLRDERGEKPEAQDGCEHEHDADHRGQRSGRAQQRGGIAVGHHESEVGAREDRDRRRGARRSSTRELPSIA